MLFINGVRSPWKRWKFIGGRIAVPAIEDLGDLERRA